MKNTLKLTAAMTLLAGTAFAAGLDRSGQSTTFIFEEGNAIQMGYSSVSPDVTGVFAHPLYGDLDSGSASDDYSDMSFAGKIDSATGKYSFAVIYDQPFGANTNYPVDGFTQGLNATFESKGLSFIGKVKATDRISLFAGATSSRISAELNKPSSAYSVISNEDDSHGWLIGAAYEIPEYALRVDATYRSAVEHKGVKISESIVHPLAGPMTFDDTIDVTMPQSFNLNVQTGINDKTLVFAGLRWVEWTAFDITTPVGGELVSYENDTISYNVGVGRKITDNFSILGSIGYEASTDEVPSLLSPTNGRMSYNLGAQYKIGNTKIAAGYSYVNLGDGTGVVVADPLTADFKDNTATGFGIKLTQSF